MQGENCDEIEYCYRQPCPEQSTCNTLKDGYECVTNINLDGRDSVLTYSPSLTNSVDIRSIKLKFRTQSEGTLMQLVKVVIDDQDFIVTIQVQSLSPKSNFKGLGLGVTLICYATTYSRTNQEPCPPQIQLYVVSST